MPPALPQWPQAWFRRGQRLWRQFLRHERPHRLPGRWNAQAGVSIGLACMLVGLLSAWPWLVQPTLRPGVPAPFEARAPGAATVVDSEALEQRRSQLGPRVQVQITDPQANKQLQQRLDRLLQELASSSRSHEKQLTPVSVTPKEQLFLESAGPQQLTTWGNQLRLAQQRMLAQGVVGSLASGQLLQASWLQLEQLEEPGRSLGAKVITRSLQGSTNLRTDNSLTQLLLNDLINETGIPKIQVRAGEVITRRGEPLSQRSYDVLDHFGLISRRPALAKFLGSWLEAVIGCGLLVMICRRWKPDLEAPQALLVLGSLGLVQFFKLWFGAAASPLALLVPPSLLLAEGLGPACGLAWLALATLLWPVPLNAVATAKLVVAAAVAVAAR